MIAADNRLSAADYLKEVGSNGAGPAPVPGKPKKNKWRNKPTWYESPTVGLMRFDSKREATRARYLDTLALTGKITAWWSQYPIYCGFDNDNGSPCRMMVDFKILWTDGSVTYEDAKGPKPTQDWILKRKAVRDLHSIDVTTV